MHRRDSSSSRVWQSGWQVFSVPWQQEIDWSRDRLIPIHSSSWVYHYVLQVPQMQDFQFHVCSIAVWIKFGECQKDWVEVGTQWGVGLCWHTCTPCKGKMKYRTPSNTRPSDRNCLQFVECTSLIRISWWKLLVLNKMIFSIEKTLNLCKIV